MTTPPPQLARRLGLADAIIIGLGSMIGAGIFSALGPAAAAAGNGLLIALAVAAVIAYANATSTARLAALYPRSGGSYVYGTERLGPIPGFLAGWCFVVGKSASAAAMALTVGAAIAPEHARWIAIAAVLALTLLSTRGIQKSAVLTRIMVAVVLVVLAIFEAVALIGGVGDYHAVSSVERAAAGAPLSDLIGASTGITGILAGAGLLFFAFAGYARIATLGAEVRAPEHIIPRAIPIALAITLVVYALVALAALSVLGPGLLAQSPSALVDAATALAGAGSWLVLLVAAAAIIGSVGSLLGLLLGISRTSFAMAEDRWLPQALNAVHPIHQVPHRAEWVVAIVVCLGLLITDLRHAIGFSSFGVLLYYAIANLSALTLRPDESRGTKLIPVIGLIGCLTLVCFLPARSILATLAVIGIGFVVAALRHRHVR